MSTFKLQNKSGISLTKEMIETAKYIRCEGKWSQDTSNQLTGTSFRMLLHMKILRKDLRRRVKWFNKYNTYILALCSNSLSMTEVIALLLLSSLGKDKGYCFAY